MTAFQIISVIFSTLILFGAIVGVYVKFAVQLKAVEVEIIALKHDLQLKEIAIINLERNNRDDHILINGKLDKLIENVNRKI